VSDKTPIKIHDIGVKIRYFKQLVKVLFSREEPIVNYRLYWIAKLHFHKKSGIFSIGELLDLLCQSYGYSSLSHKPGNKRHKYAKKFTRAFEQSILFEKLDDGRFKYIPERKIINVRRSSVVDGTMSDLESQKAFTDIMIGCSATGNSFKSYKTIAKQTHTSSSRCFKALARLNRSGRVRKTRNYILAGTSLTLAPIMKIRRDLVYNHGISTPKSLRYKGVYYFFVYAPNSYSHTDTLTASETSTWVEPLPYKNNRRCRFHGILYKKTGLKIEKLKKLIHANVFVFNDTNPGWEGHFTYGDYILEFSKQF
jgi:hypothetical protein